MCRGLQEYQRGTNATEVLQSDREVSGVCSDAAVVGLSVRENGVGSEGSSNAHLDETIPYGKDNPGKEKLSEDDDLVVSDAVFSDPAVRLDDTSEALMKGKTNGRNTSGDRV